MVTSYRIQALSADQDRSDFQCGVAPLDRYFREQVGQDIRRRVTACYVALDADTENLAGYYTLAATGVPLAEMPEALARRLPRYSAVPAARLGRLAVAQQHRGCGLGSALLWDAYHRASRSEVAVFALVVDAKDDEAVAFYRHHGLVSFGSAGRQLIIPLTRKPIP